MNDGAHDPDLQSFEQQSPASVQESPRVLQPLPPGSAAQLPEVQSPVQHPLPVVQVVSSCLHAVSPHVPPAQESEQHSPEETQAAPPALQKVLVVQLPLLHTAEQQSAEAVQWAPAAPQVEDGEAQAMAVPTPVGAQRPEQQSELAAQEAVRPAQVLGGLVQIPLAQALVQQSAMPAQAAPSAPQSEVLTHRLPAQPRPLQQSDGSEQAWPLVAQAGTWQVLGVPDDGHTRPMQQSPSVRQVAPPAPQLAAPAQVPPVQVSEPLQHGTVGEQLPPVAPQTAGATQEPPAHESAPLQHGTVPEQEPPVLAQVAGAVQMLPVQESAPLQQGTAVEQAPPVPAQVAGAVQVPAVQVSAPLQQSASVAQPDPVCLRRGGATTPGNHRRAGLSMFRRRESAHRCAFPAVTKSKGAGVSASPRGFLVGPSGIEPPTPTVSR